MPKHKNSAVRAGQKKYELAPGPTPWDLTLTATDKSSREQTRLTLPLLDIPVLVNALLHYLQEYALDLEPDDVMQIIRASRELPDSHRPEFYGAATKLVEGDKYLEITLGVCVLRFRFKDLTPPGAGPVEGNA